MVHLMAMGGTNDGKPWYKTWQRWYKVVAVVRQSLEYVKEELRKGNPVMFWGRVGLSDVTSSRTTHVMIFMGYKDGAFLVQDAAYGDISMGRRWFSETRVENYLKIKGRKMVVVR